MGEAGQAVLVSLYDEDEVSDRVGAAMLRSLIAAEPQTLKATPPSRPSTHTYHGESPRLHLDIAHI